MSDGSIISLGISYSTDLGFANTSRIGNAIITKYSSDGTKEWVKNFDKTDKAINFKNAIVLDDDSLLVVCGKVESNIGNAIVEKDDIATTSILKISKDGTKLWEKEYTNANTDVVISDIKKSSDNNIILTGYTYDINNKDSNKLVVAKLDKDLNEIWFTTDNYFDSVKGASIAEGIDGEIYVAGDMSDDSSDGTEGYLSRFDSKTGECEWESTLVGEKDETFNSISINSKGEIIVVGHSNSPLDDTDISNNTELIMAKYGVDGTKSDIASLGTEMQGIVANSVFVDKNDNVMIAGKLGKDVGNVPCELINPCLQYDAVLLSVDEELESPVYCNSAIPTLVANDTSIVTGEKVDPLKFVSIKETDLKDLAENITFKTNLEKSDNQYVANRPGEYYIEYELANDCGSSTSLKIKVIATDSTCEINPPTISSEDTYTYVIGDDFDAFTLIKVANMNTSKIKSSKIDTIDGNSVETRIYESGDKIVVTSNINFEKAGEYHVNYKVSNECGESTKDIKVIVKEKGSSSNSNGTTQKPQTGDNILTYIGLGIVAISGLAIVNKKNNKKIDENNESNNN